jgi:DNA-binding NtrC family response regulator
VEQVLVRRPGARRLEQSQSSKICFSWPASKRRRGWSALRSSWPDLVILDLTTNGWDYEAFFAALESVSPRPPVLGYTTHVLAKATQPLHGRCTRVVTKETLTQELPELLKSGVTA